MEVVDAVKDRRVDQAVCVQLARPRIDDVSAVKGCHPLTESVTVSVIHDRTKSCALKFTLYLFTITAVHVYHSIVDMRMIFAEQVLAAMSNERNRCTNTCCVTFDIETPRLFCPNRIGQNADAHDKLHARDLILWPREITIDINGGDEPTGDVVRVGRVEEVSFATGGMSAHNWFSFITRYNCYIRGEVPCEYRHLIPLLPWRGPQAFHPCARARVLSPLACIVGRALAVV